MGTASGGWGSAPDPAAPLATLESVPWGYSDSCEAGATGCPWANRTWLALEIAGAKYELKEIDLQNKPDWFLKISTKVPAVTVNGEILVESAITTRYVAELFPEAGLLSSDPLINAKSQLWADRFIETLPAATIYPIFRGVERTDAEIESSFFEALDKAIPYLQPNKKDGDGPFAAGQSRVQLGDVLVAPFVGRINLLIEKGIIPSSIKTKLTTDPKYASYVEYVKAIHDLPAFKKIFNVDAIYQSFAKRIQDAKKQ
ncbi:hypothetical protein AWJ20_491 [Sugiyamaella lignohabitans]|uniref:GST N-terminal domain-containing protein n=1 Tax=Sugiyamaella lignohabitans TaxID=796027 RepID=A0A167CY13_9ASCO|nr:uncharacterized protein AWJ20_491 [Sugiyamaella lignohabitans]ANB12242.1 hypothetical protein AWJ20_491 [Sugiyamaella lignohabitans]